VSRSNRFSQVLTLRCEAASELSSRELDEPLPFLDRAALLCHVMVCRSCRRFRVQVKVIRQAVRRRERALATADATECRLSVEARNRITLACREVEEKGLTDHTDHN
jgi:hypothetical protein